MGQMSNYCLLYFPEEKQYKFILLESEGDWHVKNISTGCSKINTMAGPDHQRSLQARIT